MKADFVFLLTLAAATPVMACGFHYGPASAVQFYRQEGWVLPGLSDINFSSHARAYALPPLLDVLRNVPNAKAHVLPLDENHQIIRMPEQVFELDGVRQKMMEVIAKATIVRVEVNGKVVAYSYGLIPVSRARQKNGKWTYEAESLCVFFANFIDDKGDGVFRMLVPGALTKDSIPAWAKPSLAL